jgi:hypothetical protein
MASNEYGVLPKGWRGCETVGCDASYEGCGAHCRACLLALYKGVKLTVVDGGEA